MHITQGDYDGKAVIISWVTPDEPGSNHVQYGTSKDEYKTSAEGTVTNYTFYTYKSGYIHHCLVDGLEVTNCWSHKESRIIITMFSFFKGKKKRQQRQACTLLLIHCFPIPHSSLSPSLPAVLRGREVSFALWTLKMGCESLPWRRKWDLPVTLIGNMTQERERWPIL